MKTIKLVLLILILSSFCKIIIAQNTGNFIINGHIDGLKTGDTINIDYVLLPDWKIEKSDTIIAQQADVLVYNKELPNTAFLMLSHLPKDRPKAITNIRGATLLASPGDKLTLKGNERYFGALKISGGFYNDPTVSRLNELESIHYTKSIDLYRDLHNARQTKQEDSILKYAGIYNSHKRSDEHKLLEKYIKDEVNDSEFSVLLYLQDLYDIPYQKLEERFARYTKDIQDSFMGQHLNHMRKVLKNIEVGNNPSDFTVIDNKGNKLKLSDYRGKYVLIYHWGMCPGAIWAQPQLLELYNRFHDKGFEVIGFTPDNYFEGEPRADTPKELEILFNQPWTTVYTDNEANKFIGEDYYFAGFPILMLISPEGKTLTRGYTDALEPTKKIIQENLSAN
ncbi:peroxiredoxin [Prevotella sp. 10(H)]|uniref:peroxiredoxin family protein n=1 Tax=Prevotella sp. 10(H) TaxID=1158294 RepID=UPI0004A6ACCB|nr:redoxin domain-containing protein [Prevotella sp. 10(H)]